MVAQFPSPKKRKAEGNVISPDNSTLEAPTTSTANVVEQEERTTKRMRELASSLSEEFTCAITHELMADPVTAEDGNTYERSAIMQWLQTNTKSPLDPSTIIDPSRLIGSRVIYKSIEKLVMSGDIDEELRTEWLERKKEVDLAKAQKLYDEGKVLEAANLGLPEAQGKMAHYHYFGLHGFEKNEDKAFAFSTKAAESGDGRFQFQAGVLYWDVAKNYCEALKWLERVADQPCHPMAPVSAHIIGQIYEKGGNGVHIDLAVAFSWYKTAADAGHPQAQSDLGMMFYHGKGVARSLATARSWYQLSADQGNAPGQCFLGMMMVKGEGGSRILGAGTILLEKAAAQGNNKAREILSGYIVLCSEGTALR